MNETTATPEIIVGFDDVKMKDFRAYWQAVARNDWQEQDAFFAKVVKQWPFAGDPSDAESYGKLDIDQFMAVQKAIKLISVGRGASLWSDFKSGYNGKDES